MDVPPDISILIPCHNEEGEIEPTVHKLLDKMIPTGIAFEILCVNNFSTDRTEHILRRLSEEHAQVRYVNTPPIPGYGIAVRWGLEFYRGNAVVLFMADGSEAPEDVIAFYRKLEEGYDCAFGTRFVPGAEVVDYPKLKLLLNRLGNWLIATVTNVKYNDFTNGFKCYRREIIDLIKPLNSYGFNLTVEMSINAVYSNARFAIVTNSWGNRSAGTSKFRLFQQSGGYLLTVAYCWLRHKIQGSKWLPFKEALDKAKFAAP
jgi:dolichol-phosphate mannosyltransferase